MNNVIPNALVRGFGVSANGMPSGQDFYITESGGGGSNTSAVRTVPSGTTDTALPTDRLIQWDSPTAGTKTENIPVGLTNGQTLQINDGEGTASVYPITLAGIGIVTIGGNATLTLSDNFFNITLVWDGFSNWIITSYYNGNKSVVGPSYMLTEDGNIILTEDGNPITLE